MSNLISSFYDCHLYGGATIASDGRLLCESSGAYASLRIQADPLSEITVRCLVKATGTPDSAGVSIAYPDVSTQITSLAADTADWDELEVKFIVPMDTNNDGYVDIRFGSVTTGTAWFVKPVVEVRNGSRFSGGVIAAAQILIDSGSTSFVSSVRKFGFESVEIDASSLWLNVTLSSSFESGSSLLPIVAASLDVNTATTAVQTVRTGTFTGDKNRTFRVLLKDTTNSTMNLSSVSARINLSVVGM